MDDRNRGGKHRQQGADWSPETSSEGSICVVDRTSESLVADDDDWIRVGRELKRVDPARYLTMIALAQDIVAIHRDPIHARRQVDGNLVFPKAKDDRDVD